MLKNLPPRFVEELEKPGSLPFAVLTVDSRGQSHEETSEADWHGATTLTNVDHDPTPPTAGDVILAPHASNTTDGDKYFSIADSDDSGGLLNPPGNFYANVDDDPHDSDISFIAVGNGGYIDLLAGGASILSTIPENANIHSVTLLPVSKYLTVAGTNYHRLTVNGSLYEGTGYTPTLSYVQYSYEWTTNPDTASAWLRADLLDIEQIGVRNAGGSAVRWTQLYLIVKYKDFEATGQLVTSTMDLGATANTANNGTVSIDDVVPTGSGLAYTAEGSTSGAWGGEEVALGAVQDGSTVDGYRYYRVTANFTSDGSVTPVLKSIKIEIPDRVYRLTSRSGGIFGALPYLIGVPGRTIAIDLKDFVTLGSELKAKLQKDDYVKQMLRENYFKNLNASVRIGLYRDDITEADLAFTFQGKVSGYSVGMEEVSISLKGGTKDLSANWPAGIATAKDGIHMVDVINTIMDDVGIAARYINRGSLDTLKANVGDGSPASSNYVVYRGNNPPVATGDTTITEPETAKKVVGELLELLGAYMVSQEDGKINVVEFDASKASVGDPWTQDDFVEDPTYNPDVENIINDTFIYLDWTGEGTDAKDFDDLSKSPDATSKTNWDETNTRIIKSKWLAGSAGDGYYGAELATHIGARETERRKNGMGIFPCRTHLSEFAIQVGDMKDIDLSDVIINPDVGVGDTRKFMIVSKDPEWENHSISWLLVEAR